MTGKRIFKWGLPLLVAVTFTGCGGPETGVKDLPEAFNILPPMLSLLSPLAQQVSGGILRLDLEEDSGELPESEEGYILTIAGGDAEIRAFLPG